ncbi:cytochrome c oxidase subunit II [Pseudanabaena yagii]|uniref:Cytochrome c oxidase subunit 2 n=1 Tax=Pseudanabaena yagii GIHE-NHR1 TaxID=2722753 RepID=A0ABX1LWM9_9CYAN|nr:cytochrome c oxidase subunit II [Pseudanabaena yagii]NMF59761.1 cytochrome c oxidase subunit II [Pseudanabaena yagii GIHE-NHR1]
MKLRTILILSGIAIAIALISLWMGQQAYTWFPPQASAESILVDNLFSFLVTLGTFIFLGVIGTLSYSVLFQRADKYDSSDGPPIEGNVKLEIIWTAIPIALVIWIAGYSYQIYDQMSILGPMEHVHMMAAAQAAPMDQDKVATTENIDTENIDVIARQWSWEFRYGNVNSTELHLPNNRRIKLTLHSEDVLHGFYVPAFRVKQDVIPGRDIDFEFTPIREGKYRLRDSEYSGTYFASMQTDVVVESPEAYQQWLADAAKRSPIAAYNPASAEYKKRSNNQWKIVVPAAPPVVNYSNSQASAL